MNDKSEITNLLDKKYNIIYIYGKNNEIIEFFKIGRTVIYIDILNQNHNLNLDLNNSNILIYDKSEIGKLSFSNKSDLVIRTFEDTLCVYKNRYGLNKNEKIKTDSYIRFFKLRKLIYNKK